MKNKIARILNAIRPEFDFFNSDNFIEDGVLDSFDIISLVAELDKEFKISIDGTDILPENFISLDSIKKLLIKNKVEI